MKINVPHIILGFLGGLITPILLGLVIAAIQGVRASTFIWSVFHLSPVYNTAFQVGVAGDIGIFFLLMRYPKLTFIARGWMVAIMLAALVAMISGVRGF
jgi:hypothetical protein